MSPKLTATFVGAHPDGDALDAWITDDGADNWDWANVWHDRDLQFVIGFGMELSADHLFALLWLVDSHLHGETPKTEDEVILPAHDEDPLRPQLIARREGDTWTVSTPSEVVPVVLSSQDGILLVQFEHQSAPVPRIEFMAFIDGVRRDLYAWEMNWRKNSRDDVGTKNISDSP